jgi:hypothetical protein
MSWVRFPVVRLILTLPSGSVLWELLVVLGSPFLFLTAALVLSRWRLQSALLW